MLGFYKSISGSAVLSEDAKQILAPAKREFSLKNNKDYLVIFHEVE